MGSQERVGEFKCGFICSVSLEVQGNCKLLNSCAPQNAQGPLKKVGISMASITVYVIDDDLS